MQGSVELSAIKSQLGHTEAGAGALGAYQAILRTRDSMLHPLTHLRNLNPHLIPVLESTKAPRLVMPKQAGPGVCQGGIGSFTTGVSSFAFQVYTKSHIEMAIHAQGLATLLEKD